MVGRLRIAKEVADAAGTTISQASRYVRDVGTEAAQTTARAANNNRKLVAGGGAAGVGGVAWNQHREQDVRMAEAAAEQAQAETDATDQLATLVENEDLPPDVRRKLVEGLADHVDTDEESDGRPRDDGDGGGGFLDILGLGDSGGLGALSGEATKMVLLLVVVVFVLNYGLAQASTTAVSAGGTR